MDWARDVVVGAFASGVNLPTYVLLNIVIGVGYAILVALLVLSIYSKPYLVPHVLVMLGLATGLWLSINWFISNIGLVDSKEQQAQVLGSTDTDQADESAQVQQADTQAPEPTQADTSTPSPAEKKQQ